MRIFFLCLVLLLPISARADWPLWQAYVTKFVQKDGRTIDYAAEDKTTSEGQAYTLFFSLVSNDRSTFEKVLEWTQNNLAQGDLSAHLPAWSWGKHGDKWEVIDANSASDADLWLAYTLLEAGRLWHEGRFSALGKLLLARIEKEEVVELPGFGPMLIPGPQGFRPDEKTWRLNPSYMPFMILKRFDKEDGRWGGLADNAFKMIKQVSPHHLVPNWAAYRADKGFIVDPLKGDLGGYDAIRVYLWAGMLSREDWHRDALLLALSAMRDALRKDLVPPLEIHAQSGTTEGSGPLAFSAALLPYLKAFGADKLLKLQQDRMNANRKDSLIGSNPMYYDQVLSMFGEGWMEGRFRFDESGRCVPAWEK